MKGNIKQRWNAVAALAVISIISLSSHATENTISDSDIVVIAKKMRTVRLNFELFGPHLKTCNIEISSGDPKIDRIMCSVLNKCIRDGHREINTAKRCVNSRIDELDGSYGTYLNQEKREVSTIARSESAAVVKDEGNPEIVVTAPGNIREGLWQVHESSIVVSDAGFAKIDQPSTREICIAKEALNDAAVKLFVGAASNEQPSHCNRWNVSINNGAVSGTRRCMMKTVRIKSELKGEVGDHHINAIITTIISNLTISNENDITTKITAKRLGDCKK